MAVLDTRGAWRTVIVVGDLDTARYVSYLVPGMFFSVQNQVDDWVTTAQELYDAQRRWLSRLGERGGVATVAWIGYKTPGLGAVGSVSLAESGADYLEASLLGLRTARRGDEPFVSVLAHSYGSTAALLALQRHTVSVNSLALLGSPGSDAHSVSALDVTGGAVYAARAKFDPVGESGYFGSTPTSDSYGATVLSVAGGTDPLTGRSLDPSYGHNEYFTPGSESMRNLALIAIGRGGLVLTTAHPGSRLDSVRARALLLLR